MAKRKKNGTDAGKGPAGKDPAGKDAAPGGDGKPEEEKGGVSVGAWEERRRVVRRAFPGPSDADEALRVAFESGAYAELVAHAKESLDKEVCGVLAGEVCQDDRGRFAHVKAVVRGASAREGGSHVTYTQETWNAIHAELEEKHPKLSIVGWYHSHPGFGVEFSEMDEFIQQNFFSGATQIAFVTDPLGGDEAICFNDTGGIRHVERFWVDGRERRCHVPANADDDAGDDHGPQAASPEALRNVEAKLGQLVQAFDEQQASYYRFLMTVGIFVACVVVPTPCVDPSVEKGISPSALHALQRRLPLDVIVRLTLCDSVLLRLPRQAGQYLVVA
jgi:proteasome lid subunit RPN8/RPN11